MKKTIYLLLFIFICSNNLFGQNYERYKKLRDTTITSKYLGFDKNITITVPFEWQKDQKRDYPLIIIFDRQNQRSHNYILNTIDYLTSNEQIPSAIIIGVESEQKYRYLETLHKASSQKGLAEENESFIFNELIPLAEEQYYASNFRLFIGHSRYGYFTSYLLVSRINELNGVISLSPFFTQNNVDLTDSIRTIKNQVFNSKKYYRFGIGKDYPSDFSKMDSTIKQLNNSKLDCKGFLFKEADHNVTPGLTIGTSLYEIFEDWSKIQSKYISNEQKELEIIDSLEEEVLSIYGNRLEFSLGILNGKGWYFYNEEEYEKAIEAWTIMLKAYPNFSEGYLYIIDAQIKLNQDISKNIKRFNQSLVTSQIYSEKDKKELKDELNIMMK
ncbi:MAG TPA: alpha/beta hydrolase-fold protein [Bacteroidales bacterium]|nr:alpha/beta hydrolase-fold protein [Bacteroidales bacterium]